MNKNYNKFFNKNENLKTEPDPKVEPEIVSLVRTEMREMLDEEMNSEKVCNGEECENCKCESSSQPEPEVKNKDRQVSNCEYLNLRVDPNKQSEVLSIIKKGTTLTLLEPISDDNEWVKVKVHKTGLKGFIMKDYTI